MGAIDRIRATATLYPDAIALTCGSRHYTYTQLIQEIDLAADFLIRNGMDETKRVALILPNIPEFPFFFYACEQIGATPVMIHPLTSPSKMKMLCEMSKVDLAIICDVLHLKARRELSSMKIVLISSRDLVSFPLYLLFVIKGKLPFNPHILYRRNTNRMSNHSSSNATHFILFTSGSKGINKGIRLNFKTLNSLCDQLKGIIDPVPTQDTMFSILPFFHGFGLGVGMHTVLALGGRCVLVPRIRRNTIVTLFLKEKPNYLIAVPQLLRLFLNDPRIQSQDLSFLKNVFCGGEAVSESLIHDFDILLKNGKSTAFVQVGYGCTETLTAVCVTQEEQRGVGRPFIGNRFLLIDDQGNEVPPNHEGEICISGPTLMDDYDPPIEGDHFIEFNDIKYYRSADIGRIDEEGDLHVLYRKDDLLKVNGYFVSPIEIETKVTTSPWIGEAVAFLNNEGILCLAFTSKSQVKIDLLKKEITDRLDMSDRWCIPRKYYWFKEIPKNEMKKTDRIKLKQDLSLRQGNGLLGEWSL